MSDFSLLALKIFYCLWFSIIWLHCVWTLFLWAYSAGAHWDSCISRFVFGKIWEVLFISSNIFLALYSLLLSFWDSYDTNIRPFLIDHRALRLYSFKIIFFSLCCSNWTIYVASNFKFIDSFFCHLPFCYWTHPVSVLLYFSTLELSYDSHFYLVSLLRLFVF